MTKEGFTKLTGLKPTDEEFEVINGFCTEVIKLSRAFSKTVVEVDKEKWKKLGLGDYKPLSEEDFCRTCSKDENATIAFIGGYIYMFLSGLSPNRSDDSFKSFERELCVTVRMMERGYKLSLDDRRMLLEKAKAAAQEYNGK